MDVEIDNRIRCSRDTCPHADIVADVEEFKAIGGVCMARVTVECAHSGICRYENEGDGERWQGR